jgi:hypothetical protein
MNKDDDPIPPIPGYRPGVPHFQPVCPKGLDELLSSTSNTSAPVQDAIGNQALRLRAKIDSEGLCYLTNLLITQGLPKALKTAKVVVIGKPGKNDFGSGPGRHTTDALMWLKAVVEKNRKENMNTGLKMTEVAAAFPGTRPSTVLRTIAPLVDPKIYRWILSVRGH